MQPMMSIPTDGLKLGDFVVQQDSRGVVLDREFSTCIVIKVEDDRVNLFRPYGVTADFSYTGGVIPYMGAENYWVEKERTILWKIYRRQELK